MAPVSDGGTALALELQPGDRLVAGTCEMQGEDRGKHLLLTVSGPDGATELSHDDLCDGSQIEFVVPAGAGGLHRLETSCFDNEPCPSQIAWSVERGAAVVGEAEVEVSSGGALARLLLRERGEADVDTDDSLDTPPIIELGGPPRPMAGAEDHEFGGEVRIALQAGERLTAGTCGLPDAYHHGDTTLRLFDPSGRAVAFNDDACGGLGSRLTHTATISGEYRVALGCYSGRSCSGRIAWSVEGPGPRMDPAASEGTVAHVPGEETALWLERGQRVVIGTCGVEGAHFEGDTTLLLLGPSGNRVAFNDDACGSLGSRIDYRAPEAGEYRIRAGCFAGSGCGGVIAWQSGDAAGPADYRVRLSIATRGMLGMIDDGASGGLLSDALFEWRIAGMSLRLEANPVGFGGGSLGGIFAGGAQFTTGFDLGPYVELGTGVGWATASIRPAGSEQRDGLTLANRLRIGSRLDFHVEATATIGMIFDGEEEAIPFAIGGTAVLPIDDFDLVLRGRYGFEGAALGELAVTLWFSGNERRGLALTGHIGGAALFYQPVCRFGLECETGVYAGPHLGLGIEFRD